MADRISTIERKTGETDIKLTLNLDGKGEANVDTGIGFLDHMLKSFAKHGYFDLDVTVKGDLYVDSHHSIEDTGIVLGKAIKEAIGDKAGIKRYGSFAMPMDETLILSAVDLSGRPLWNYYGMPLALPYHHNPAYICFYGSMAFGFGCTFAVYYAGPYFYSLYHNIPSKPKWIILSLLIAAMVADCCVTIFYKKNPGGVDESGLENVKETIRLIGGK